jgi:hypothetical protein
MRAFTGGLAAATFLATATLALAAQHAEGTIRSIDARSTTLTLSDGQAYVLPKGFDATTLKNGEKVAISYDVQSGRNVASAVTMVK